MTTPDRPPVPLSRNRQRLLWVMIAALVVFIGYEMRAVWRLGRAHRDGSTGAAMDSADAATVRAAGPAPMPGSR